MDGCAWAGQILDCKQGLRYSSRFGSASGGAGSTYLSTVRAGGLAFDGRYHDERKGFVDTKGALTGIKLQPVKRRNKLEWGCLDAGDLSWTLSGISMVERMEAFGHELREERERRGVTIETICSMTKVSARHLESLEASRFRELPGGVFRKGIVRSYLTALGLEEVWWMQRFEEALRVGGHMEEEDKDFTIFAENVERSRPRRPPGEGLRWLGVLLMAALLAYSGWAAWKYVVKPKIRQAVPQSGWSRQAQIEFPG